MLPSTETAQAAESTWVGVKLWGSGGNSVTDQDRKILGVILQLNAGSGIKQ